MKRLMQVVTALAVVISVGCDGAAGQVGAAPESESTVVAPVRATGQPSKRFLDPGRTSTGAALNAIAVPSAATSALTYGMVDFPNAEQTQTVAISDTGVVVGAYGPYVDGYFMATGFLMVGTTFLPIRYPGAAMTVAEGISPDGLQVVGAYSTTQGAPWRGFVLRGLFARVDYPGAVETFPLRVNRSGVIAGTWDDGVTSHGFKLENGGFTSIDVPGAAATFLLGLNDAGVMVGYYVDANDLEHGFIYEAGAFTTYDYPGATNTELYGVNDGRQVVGAYGTKTNAPNSFVQHGFISVNGVASAVTVPFAGAAATLPYSVNNKGQLAGSYVDENQITYGFTAR